MRSTLTPKMGRKRRGVISMQERSLKHFHEIYKKHLLHKIVIVFSRFCCPWILSRLCIILRGVLNREYGYLLKKMQQQVISIWQHMLAHRDSGEAAMKEPCVVVIDAGDATSIICHHRDDAVVLQLCYCGQFLLFSSYSL
mmetsp:Transcript_20389/g.32855  ORF Transcript_20389/g.32855 Transcript_20389/m.32855 type:complete len:140 (+) Transcript_20389:1484-1903(+)